MIYLDNAATSWPKPPEVLDAVTHFLQENGANPGRSGHRRSVEASRIVYAAREALCQLVNGPDPLRVVFGHNITDALNLALFGLLRSGDHVVTSSMEHNSVMRPLSILKLRGLEVSVVKCSSEGYLNPYEVEAAIRPDTRLLVINHGSNVTGTVQPLKEIGSISRKHNTLLLVDCAQTAGAFPIDMKDDAIDLLAFTGHKALLGLTGTGGLIIGERVDVDQLIPLKFGGTGSHSESELQPSFLPDKYESGTINAVGLAGLNAGVRWLLDCGLASVRAHEKELIDLLLDGLSSIPAITVYGGHATDNHVATVGFNVAGLQPSDVALQLDDNFEIMCRSGLHCAPAAHRTIGTFPIGCVRFSLGMFTSKTEIDAVLSAVNELRL